MSEMRTIETDVLVVGAGPAGATASALLSSFGVDNIMLNKFGTTSRTPRAHITNQRAMEVFRDLGVENEFIDLSIPQKQMGEHIFAVSLIGDELGRVHSWGNAPDTSYSHQIASPTQTCDIAQHLFEPILVKRAAWNGSTIKFHNEFISLEQDDDGVTSIVRDRITDYEYKIRSKYLVGADGGNSRVAEQVGLPFEGKMGLAGQINIVFDGDLSRYVAHRPGVMYWFMQPGPGVGGMGIGVLRAVRQFHEWVCVWGYDVEAGPPELTDDMAKDIVYKLIGEREVPIRIKSLSSWTINDMHALENMRGRVFCIGDAVHRHPPTNGLGSNTCVCDSHNLAWKLAMAVKGQAGAGLLNSYNDERVPVGKQIVKRAIKSVGELHTFVDALRMDKAASEEEAFRNMENIKKSTDDAAKQRAALREAVEISKYDFDAHGAEMNQRYESEAIIPDGSPDPGFEKDRDRYYTPSARPGAHVPHAWLTTQDGHRVSTFDLCGKGMFSLLTGLGGEIWRDAAAAVKEELGVDINVHIIGPGQEYADGYGYFESQREIEEAGALLVRPDHFIAWRAMDHKGDPINGLLNAMRKILDRS